MEAHKMGLPGEAEGGHAWAQHVWESRGQGAEGSGDHPASLASPWESYFLFSDSRSPTVTISTLRSPARHTSTATLLPGSSLAMSSNN